MRRSVFPAHGLFFPAIGACARRYTGASIDLMLPFCAAISVARGAADDTVSVHERL
jgi:hypothetical protein